MSKFKIGDKVEIVGNVTTKGIISTIKDIETCRDSVFSYVWSTFYLLNNTKGKYLRTQLKKVEEGEDMSKTFKEVIADIKEREVWESGIKSNIKLIEKVDGDIRIKFNNPTGSYLFLEETKYTLQRKKVSFTEAFKAYEESKEIESCVDGCIFKKINGEDNYKFHSYNSFSTKCDEEDYWLGFEHVRGEWYINE